MRDNIVRAYALLPTGLTTSLLSVSLVSMKPLPLLPQGESLRRRIDGIVAVENLSTFSPAMRSPDMEMYMHEVVFNAKSHFPKSNKPSESIALANNMFLPPASHPQKCTDAESTLNVGICK